MCGVPPQTKMFRLHCIQCTLPLHSFLTLKHFCTCWPRTIHVGMMDMTGAPCKTVDFDEAAVQARILSGEAWKDLLFYDKENYIMSASSRSDGEYHPCVHVSQCVWNALYDHPFLVVPQSFVNTIVPLQALPIVQRMGITHSNIHYGTCIFAVQHSVWWRTTRTRWFLRNRPPTATKSSSSGMLDLSFLCVILRK